MDPYHPETIADGIERVLTDSVLRADRARLHGRSNSRGKHRSGAREIYREVLDAPGLRTRRPAARRDTGEPSALSAPRVALVHD